MPSASSSDSLRTRSWSTGATTSTTTSTPWPSASVRRISAWCGAQSTHRTPRSSAGAKRSRRSRLSTRRGDSSRREQLEVGDDSRVEGGDPGTGRRTPRTPQRRANRPRWKSASGWAPSRNWIKRLARTPEPRGGGFQGRACGVTGPPPQQTHRSHLQADIGVGPLERAYGRDAIMLGAARASRSSVVTSSVSRLAAAAT